MTDYTFQYQTAE